MSIARISYHDTLRGIVSADDLDGMVNLVENHKNWGAFKARLPSYIIVQLVEAIKELKQQVEDFNYKPEPEDFPDLDDSVEDGHGIG